MPISLVDLITAAYSTDELRQAVHDDVVANGTEKAILRGRCKLPSQHDAEKWLAKKKQDAAPKSEDD